MLGEFVRMVGRENTSYYFGGAYIVPLWDETRSDGGIFKYYLAPLWGDFGGQSIVNEYKPATSTWRLSYLLTDHLGSVVAVTDASGTLTSQQRYLPFGGERTDVGTISQTDYGYTGQRDLNMGLMDYNARFYSPFLGRFIQPDSFPLGGPQTLNRYSYVMNNPINANDPSGHKCVGNPDECRDDKGKMINGAGGLRSGSSGGRAGRDNWEVDKPAETSWWDWYTGKDVGYSGSGWYFGHGPRQEAFHENRHGDKTAQNTWDLMYLAWYQVDSATITGPALEKLRTDPTMIDKQNQIVKRVMNDPRYENEAYIPRNSHDMSITFGETGNFFLNGFQGGTWIARAATVDADISVSVHGVITLNYHLSDVYDLRPDWTSGKRSGVTGFFYNVVTTFPLGPGWHDMIGASDQMTTSADWVTVIDPVNK